MKSVGSIATADFIQNKIITTGVITLLIQIVMEILHSYRKRR